MYSLFPAAFLRCLFHPDVESDLKRSWYLFHFTHAQRWMINHIKKEPWGEDRKCYHLWVSTIDVKCIQHFTLEIFVSSIDFFFFYLYSCMLTGRVNDNNVYIQRINDHNRRRKNVPIDAKNTKNIKTWKKSFEGGGKYLLSKLHHE